jgi:hypothetical protein
MTDVVMPQMGESIVEGTLTKWLKKSGERVERDEPLFEISTDKVDTEIPSPAAGTLSEVLVEEGKTVGINTVVNPRNRRQQLHKQRRQQHKRRHQLLHRLEAKPPQWRLPQRHRLPPRLLQPKKLSPQANLPVHFLRWFGRWPASTIWTSAA